MGCNHEQTDRDSLQHHGVKGMRWGVRRYQNKDGSLTPAGEKRAAKLAAKETRERLKDKQVARKIAIKKAKQQMKEDAKDRENERKNATRESKAKTEAERAKAKNDQAEEERYELPDDSSAPTQGSGRGKRLLIAAVAVVGTVAAVYAFKKIRDKYGAQKDNSSKKIEDTVKDAAEKASNKAADKAAKQAAKEAKKATKQAAKEAKKTGVWELNTYNNTFAKASKKTAKKTGAWDLNTYNNTFTKASKKTTENVTKAAGTVYDFGEGYKATKADKRATNAVLKQVKSTKISEEKARSGKEFVDKLLFAFVNTK